MKYNQKNELNKLLSSLKSIERKFKNHQYLLENLPSSEINQIFLRNCFYIYSMNEKINKKLENIKTIKKKMKNCPSHEKGKLKKQAKTETVVTIYLLQYLVKLVNSFDIENTDFEVQTVIRYKDLPSKIPSKYYMLIKKELEDINYKYNKIVIEDFSLTKKLKSSLNSVKKKLKEATNLLNKSVKEFTNMINKLFKSLQNVFKTLIKISNFILKYLKEFIMLFWKLLKFLWIFISKTIPKIIKSTWTFYKRLKIKVKKTLPITILFNYILMIALGKYFDLLFGNIESQGFEVKNSVPKEFIEYPALFFTTQLFWTETRLLSKIQTDIVNFIFHSGRRFLDFFFKIILGLPDTDIFTKKMSKSKRFSKILNYISKNILNITIRIFIFILISKTSLKDFFKKLFMGGIPHIRDILLLPVILLKFGYLNIFHQEWLKPAR